MITFMSSNSGLLPSAGSQSRRGKVARNDSTHVGSHFHDQFLSQRRTEQQGLQDAIKAATIRLRISDETSRQVALTNTKKTTTNYKLVIYKVPTIVRCHQLFDIS